MVTRITAAAAALAGALALGGCYEIQSAVPAISDGARLTSARLSPGLYCTIDGLDADVGEISGADCVLARLENGELVVESGEDEVETTTFILADLGRGMTLLQGLADSGEGYFLYVAAVREDGVAVIAEPELTATVKASADAAGVTVRTEPDDDLDAEPRDIEILEGEPDDVLEFVRDATGLWLDAALRDPDLSDSLLSEAIVYLRVDADPDEVEPDAAALTAQIEGLRAQVVRAMRI